MSLETSGKLICLSKDRSAIRCRAVACLAKVKFGLSMSLFPGPTLQNRTFFLLNKPLEGNMPEVKKYNIIYADPPWSYDDKALQRGGAERHYRTMGIDEMKQIPVKSIADDDCCLFMWATFPKLQEALDLIDAWGFKFKTCAFVWIKTNKRTSINQTSFLPHESFDSFWGMGRWTRSNAEICLLGVSGEPKRINADVHLIIYSPIDKHSKKPIETRDRIIRLVGDLPRLEMFARQAPIGWDVYGNQVNNSIKLYA
jgi:N6-adenosine-specific RNA methylase IME4